MNESPQLDFDWRSTIYFTFKGLHTFINARRYCFSMKKVIYIFTVGNHYFKTYLHMVLVWWQINAY